MKHAAILHKMDREDCWIMSPVIITLDKKYDTYEAANEFLKSHLEANPAIIEYIANAHDVRTSAYEHFEDEDDDDFGVKDSEDLKVVLKEITVANELTLSYDLFNKETPLDGYTYDLDLKVEFTVIFE